MAMATALTSKYKKLLDTYSNTWFFEVILSAILVCEEIRPAFLFESINYYSDEEKAFIYTVPALFKNIKPLVCSVDSHTYPRTFVFLKDSPVDKSIRESPARKNDARYIAQYLGFNCVGHDDYYNPLKTRITVRMFEKVRNVEYIVELCEKDKTNLRTLMKKVKAKNARINALLLPLGYESVYVVDVSVGYLERYEHLKNKDIDYVNTHSADYINDLWNFYLAGDGSSTTDLDSSLSKYHFANVTNKNITKLAKIYKLACIDNAFDTLYKNANKDMKKISKVSKMLLQHDIEFWNGTRRLEDIGCRAIRPGT
jgi:uncharacterized protein YjaG (DUF416 family)